MMEKMRRPSELGERTQSQQLIYEDFQPSPVWTHESNSHLLLLDLPGFKRGELQVQVDDLRKVTVSGERQVDKKKYSRFKQVFDVPKDSDIDKISARFNDEHLFVIIPKKETKTMEEPSKKDNQTGNEIMEGKRDDKSNNEEKSKEEDDTYKHDHGHDLHYESKRNGGKEGLNGEKIGKIVKEIWRKEDLEVLMKSAMEKISRNKTVILTTVLAFSVGFYLGKMTVESERILQPDNSSS